MVIFLGRIAHKTLCLIWNIFVKRSMQIRLVLTKKTNLKLFGRKNGICQNIVIFFGLLFVSFDPVNRFSSFKNHYTPNFKVFLLIYTLYTISKVWSGTKRVMTCDLSEAPSAPLVGIF
jgi:amino acid permease